MHSFCHPLREDVSWNYSVDMVAARVTVILFVRMWVEMLRLAEQNVTGEGHPLREDVSWNTCCVINESVIALSSSSWGCELKYSDKVEILKRERHPLREDVSWNTIAGYYTMGTAGSSSSWGCELKCDISMELVLNGNVILFVRMWVEIQ